MSTNEGEVDYNIEEEIDDTDRSDEYDEINDI